LDAQVSELAAFLPLLYETGNALEAAVLAAFRFLDLQTKKTPKGFTADFLANSDDGRYKFGLEVTGTNGPNGKRSNKLTQLTEFDRQKDDQGVKTVLIANTFNTTPADERGHDEHFTKP